MFLENEHQPIMSHSPYDLARPMDYHHHLQHHIQTAVNHHTATDHQDDSEGPSTASSPSSYRDLSGCEDFDMKIPKPSGAESVTSGGGHNNNNNNSNNNNKEQKPKKHKCKHCGLECTEKVQYWKHIRTHIKPEQLLECPNCEFATDLKHHYEYHLLNHTGAKPFTCTDCDYKCVSKSMLQSHLKSHSNVFQFQCYDCGYASKYMHSLKQHLKKRDHRPATPLNPDGTPNPDIVIDVVGNRRGPRQNKKQSRHNPYPQHHNQNQQLPMTVSSSSQDDGGSSGGHPSPYSMQQLLQLPASVVAPAAYPTSAESFMYSMITKRTMEIVDYQADYLAIKNNNNNNNSTNVDDKMEMQQHQQHQNHHPHSQPSHYHHHNHHHHQYHPEEVVQVEVAGGDDDDDYNNHHHHQRTPEPVAAPVEPSAVGPTAAAIETGPLNLSKDSVAPRAAGSSRRKGIACKLERPSAVAEPTVASRVAAMADQVRVSVVARADRCESSKTMTVVSADEMAPLLVRTMKEEPQTAKEELLQSVQQQHQSLSSPEKEDETHVCHHCDIIFKENIMYSMHMGFHSFRDPFACNLCGEITADKFSFFAHIARVPHS